MSNIFILAINPGSTSTKLALFDGKKKILAQSIPHSVEELAPYKKIIDQFPMRLKIILEFLKQNDFDVHRLSATVGRGGVLTPMESGTYLVTDEMADYLKNNPTEHASNLGAILAREIARLIGKNAYIVDPIVVDEFIDESRITGIPEIRRISIFHALNHKAAAREAARKLHKKYEECCLVVAHLGGGISIGAHHYGKVIDVNNALNGDGPMTPERAGSIPSWSLVELTLSGKYDAGTLKKMITGKGGLMAHMGTNDMREVEKLYMQGDAKAALIYRSMAFQIAKWIAAMAATMDGQVDAVVLTGGIAFDKTFIELIEKKICFLGRVIVIPGEDEMAALSQGALRVEKGEEKAKTWTLKGGQA